MGFLIDAVLGAQQWPIVNATPSTNPPSGHVYIYRKNDGVLYMLTSAGTETAIGSGGGAGVADGDKGDIVVSSSGSVWTFDSSVVTAAAKTVLDDTSTSAMRTTLGLGTAAVLDVPSSGDATSSQVVKGSDTRLTDSRTPTTHTHPATAISDSTSAGRALITAADVAAQRTALGLVIGTNVQAQDAELAALAGLTSASDKLPYFTGAGTAGLADFTAAGRALLDDANAAAQLTTLGAAAASHTHAASDIASGLIAQARLGSGSGGAGTKVLYDDQTYKTPPSGGALPDGDYGDIIVSSSGAALNLDSGVVTTAAKTVLDDTTIPAMRATLGVEKLTTFSNADYTALATDKVVAQIGTLSAVRTVTLPAANSVNAGYELIVEDRSGTIVPANYITVARTGSDTINGATSHNIRTNYGKTRFISDGVSAWTFDVVGTSRGGTGSTTTAAARLNLGTEGRTTFSNTAYTILATDKEVAQVGTMSASRTVTLPAANSVNTGYVLIVVDESGTVTATNTIVIARAGSDTIDGANSLTIDVAYGGVSLISDGTSKWTVAIQPLAAGGTGATTAAGAQINLGINAATNIVIFEDFILSQPFVTNATGAGSSVATGTANAVDTGAHPGQVELNTGTTSSGRGTISHGNAGAAQLLLGNGAIAYETLVLTDVLSDGTDTYTLFDGFNDSATTTGVDAVYFRYTHSVNSGKWECVTRSNSTETATDSGVTVAAATWYKLRIEINAAASSVAFYVGVSGGALSLVATNTTNIPSGTGRQTAPIVSILKSAGTNARRLLADYIYLRYGLTATR